MPVSFCPRCSTALLEGKCRKCDGTFEKPGVRRGAATFSGQRGRFQRPGSGDRSGHVAGQVRLMGVRPDSTRPAGAGLVERSGTRWAGAVGGDRHEVLGLFPFDTIRDGQRTLTRDVQMTVARGGCLVAHAPTGLGKTAASVAPALQHALDAGKKVLFLTSKQSQHRIVVDTLRAVVERRGARFAAVDVISKRDMCPRPEKEQVPPFAFMDLCSRLCKTKQCGYFMADAADAVEETRRGIHHVEELVDISLNHGCCPHKVATVAAKQADVVVCDYNYLFSDLRERILEAFQVGLSDLVVIVDEAHNLPERVRGNFSLDLTPYVVEEARTEARREKDVRTERLCTALLQTLEKLASGIADGEEVVLAKRELVDLVEAEMTEGTLTKEAVSVEDLVQGLGAVADARTKGGEPVARSGQLAEFLAAWQRGGRAYGRILRREPGGQWRLLHVLLDPGIIAGPIFQDVHAAILMSGTLFPPEMYRDVLGLDPSRTKTKVYASPFDPANRPVVCVKGVTSKYTARSEDMYRRIARCIVDVHRIAGGNTAAFCLSYDFAERVREQVVRLAPEAELVVETRGMGKAERDLVLDQLEGGRSRGGALLIGVLGGSLSEGVDYKGNLLRAVSVVGLPLAPPGREVDLLIEDFDRRFAGRGRDYGYVFPAMERVLQAAGRGIRGESDRCAVILLDERYAWRTYARSFPDDFRPVLVDDPADALASFFAA